MVLCRLWAVEVEIATWWPKRVVVREHVVLVARSCEGRKRLRGGVLIEVILSCAKSELVWLTVHGLPKGWERLLRIEY